MFCPHEEVSQLGLILVWGPTASEVWSIKFPTEGFQNAYEGIESVRETLASIVGLVTIGATMK